MVKAKGKSRNQVSRRQTIKELVCGGGGQLAMEKKEAQQPI